MERGIEFKALNPPMLNNRNNKQIVRRTSPLQLACSLGLFRLANELLKYGASPDGIVSLRKYLIENEIIELRMLEQ